MSEPLAIVYEILHWDTFEPPGLDTRLVGTRDSLSNAVLFVAQKYELDLQGADIVEIVQRPGSEVVCSFKIRGDRTQEPGLLEALEELLQWWGRATVPASVIDNARIAIEQERWRRA